MAKNDCHREVSHPPTPGVPSTRSGGGTPAFTVTRAPEQGSSRLQSASCSLSTPGYAAFFLFARLAQPLPNQPPRMGGAEARGALWSPGGASSLLLHRDFRLWLPSSPARRGVAKEKIGSCHLTERKAASGWSENPSNHNPPGHGKAV